MEVIKLDHSEADKNLIVVALSIVEAQALSAIMLYGPSWERCSRNIGEFAQTLRHKLSEMGYDTPPGFSFVSYLDTDETRGSSKLIP